MNTIPSYANFSAASYSSVNPVGKTVNSFSPSDESAKTPIYADTVEISAEGLAASLKQSNLTQIDPSTIQVSWQPRLLAHPAIEAAAGYTSRHSNVFAWGLGINQSGSYQKREFGTGGDLYLNDIDLKSLANNVKAESAKLDSKVSSLLKESGIQLDKDETLKFAVDQDGKVRVTDGIKSDSKAAKIEEILNADSSLGQELLLQHAKQSIAGNGLNLTGALDKNTKSILVNNVLQNELGISLSDLSINPDTMEITSSTNNEGLQSLLQTEYNLLFELRGIVHDRVGDEGDGSFEINYAFKNDTCINTDFAGEKAIANRAGQTMKLLEHAVRVQQDLLDGSAVTIRFDPNGTLMGNLDFPFNGAVGILNRGIVTDALRLHQFEHGDDEYEHEMEVTFENGSVAFRAVSPEADAATTEEINVVAGDVVSMLMEQTGQFVESLGLTLGPDNALRLKFEGNNTDIAATMNNALNLALATDPLLQEKATLLIDLLGRLHTDQPTVFVTVPKT